MDKFNALLTTPMEISWISNHEGITLQSETNQKFI